MFFCFSCSFPFPLFPGHPHHRRHYHYCSRRHHPCTKSFGRYFFNHRWILKGCMFPSFTNSFIGIGAQPFVNLMSNTEMLARSPEPEVHDKVLYNNPDRIGIWKCWCLRRGGNRRTQRKTSRSKELNQQQTQPTYDTVWESIPGHIGGRWALSPLRHPCSASVNRNYFKLSKVQTLWTLINYVECWNLVYKNKRTQTSSLLSCLLFFHFFTAWLLASWTSATTIWLRNTASHHRMDLYLFDYVVLRWLKTVSNTFQEVDFDWS